MRVSFYMDQHVPNAITRGLRRRGVDVLRVQDDGHDRADDDVILDRAGVLGRVVFTQDEDFLDHAHHHQANGIPFNGVAYADQLGVSIGRCVDDLEIISKATDTAYMMNWVEYLPI